MNKPKKFPQSKIFHICNKSIAGFKIFSNFDNNFRFLQAIDYYNGPKHKENLGLFLIKNRNYQPKLFIPEKDSLIKILSYCIMPDHYHLLLKIIKDNCLTKYINDLENSYTRFFNIKFKRKGPLWQSSFRAVLIKSDEQFLHISRYIHLNPTSAELVIKPADWIYSSYKNIITDKSLLKDILTEYSISNSINYKKFVENNRDYQQKLQLIKKLILE